MTKRATSLALLVAAFATAAAVLGLAARPAGATDSCDVVCTGGFATLQTDVTLLPLQLQPGFGTRVRLAASLFPPGPVRASDYCPSAAVLQGIATEASALAATRYWPPGPVHQLATDTQTLLATAYPPSPCLGG